MMAIVRGNSREPASRGLGVPLLEVEVRALDLRGEEFVGISLQVGFEFMEGGWVGELHE